MMMINDYSKRTRPSSVTSFSFFFCSVFIFELYHRFNLCDLLRPTPPRTPSPDFPSLHSAHPSRGLPQPCSCTLWYQLPFWAPGLADSLLMPSGAVLSSFCLPLVSLEQRSTVFVLSSLTWQAHKGSFNIKHSHPIQQFIFKSRIGLTIILRKLGWRFNLFIAARLLCDRWPFALMYGGKKTYLIAQSVNYCSAGRTSSPETLLHVKVSHPVFIPNLIFTGNGKHPL